MGIGDVLACSRNGNDRLRVVRGRRTRARVDRLFGARRCRQRARAHSFDHRRGLQVPLASTLVVRTRERVPAGRFAAAFRASCGGFALGRFQQTGAADGSVAALARRTVRPQRAQVAFGRFLLLRHRVNVRIARRTVVVVVVVRIVGGRRRPGRRRPARRRLDLVIVAVLVIRSVAVGFHGGRRPDGFGGATHPLRGGRSCDGRFRWDRLQYRLLWSDFFFRRLHFFLLRKRLLYRLLCRGVVCFHFLGSRLLWNHFL